MILLVETSESYTTTTNGQEAKEVKLSAQQQEVLMACQRAEWKTTLQNLQLPVLEFERQLSCANQNVGDNTNHSPDSATVVA